MNLIIVDDEPIIRVGLRTLIDWDRHGLALVGEASDGKEALELIERGGVDILVTDIRMPRMDGLELIRLARGVKEDLGVLVLSCLDDFAFVKEAMKLGATDYILKPTMEPEELVNILLQISDKVEGTRRERRRLSEWQAQLAQSKQAQLSVRLRRWLLDGTGDDRLEEELVGPGRDIFTVLVPAPSDAAAERQDFDELLARVRLQDLGVLLVFPAEPSLSEREGHTRRFRKAQEIAADLAMAAGNPAPSASAGLCIGPTISRLDELQHSVRLHERQLHYRFYRQADPIMWEDAPAIPLAAALPYDHRTDLLKSVAHHNADGMLYHAERIGQALHAAAPPMAKLHAFLYELMLMAVGYARDYGYAQTDEYEKLWVSMERIRSCARIDELERWLLEAMRALWECRWSSTAEPVSANPFIRKALQFMKMNYKRNIGTVDIAAYVKLSRSYLSDLYSKEMGESLIETLTRIRIEEAKKKLSAGERKIYEVAEEVGFSDPKSFAKTFKRLVGCTPKEYESQNK